MARNQYSERENGKFLEEMVEVDVPKDKMVWKLFMGVHIKLDVKKKLVVKIGSSKSI